MRKIMLALMGAFAGLSASAQFIAPTHIPLVMPPAASNDVYGCVKTSSYGYDNVNFEISPGTFASQNLHVYSWNAANYTDGGIAWVRRNTANVIVDTGWIVVPGYKYCRSVGIVQDAMDRTFVIAAYLSVGDPLGNGFKYETYLWDNTGVSATPSSPVPLTMPISYTPWTGTPSTYIPGGNRISMDCFDLDKVIFTWDESFAQYENPIGTYHTLNDGGISMAALDIGLSIAPFAPDLGATRRMNNTEHWAKNPDVAFGREGTTTRVAYMNTDTLLIAAKNILVRSQSFATIYGGTGAVTFGYDDSVTAATTMFGPADGDHLNIDCPDHLPGADPWSIVYNAAPTVIFAHTHPVTGPNANTLLNAPIAAGLNRHPVVAYGRTPSVDGINYGWYCQDGSLMGAGAFINTTLDWDGSTFSTATPPGVYRMIDSYPGGGFYEPRIAFNRQNDNNTRFKMAYPMVVIGGIWCDMRSKDINWGAGSFRPTGIDDVKTIDVMVQVYPNPFEKGFRITVKEDDGIAQYDVVLTDIQGRTILEYTGNLSSVNSRLENPGILAAGTYSLSLSSKDGRIKRNIKLTHQ
jgi:hypothetical protein